MSFLDNARRAFSSKTEEYYDNEREYDEDYEEYDEEPRKPLFSFLSRHSKDEYEDYEEEEDVKEEPEPKRYSASRFTSSARERFSSPSVKATSSESKPNLAGVEVTVHYPTSLDDAMKIVKEVKYNKITIFDVSAITSNDEARRVVDYIGGAAYGMECPFERLCPSIFCIAPTGVVIHSKKSGY